MTCVSAILSTLLVLSAPAAQDTKPTFRLQDRVPDDFNIFVEIDSVSSLIDATGSSPLNAVLMELRAFVTKQLDGKDLLKEAAEALGADPVELAGKIRGQLAAAVRYEVSMEDADAEWVVTADFGDAKVAAAMLEKITTLASLEETVVAGGQAFKGPDGQILARTGSVLWFGVDRELTSTLMGKAPSDPLKDDALFKESRELTGAKEGQIFFFANMAPLVEVAEEIPLPLISDLMEETGLSGLRAYAVSLGFDRKGVSQNQAVLLEPKTPGLLGTLAGIPNKPLDLSLLPAGTGFASTTHPEVVAALSEFAQNMTGLLSDFPGTEMALGGLEMWAVLRAGKEPMNQFMISEGDDIVWVVETEDAKAYQETLLEDVEEMGAEQSTRTEGGLELTLLETDQEEFKGIVRFIRATATHGRRFYQATSPEALVKVHRSIENQSYGKLSEAEGLKTLVGRRALKGMAFLYLEVDQFIAYLAEGLGAFRGIVPVVDTMQPVVGDLRRILKGAGEGYDVISSRDGHLIIQSRSTASLTATGTSWGAITTALLRPAVAKSIENAKITSCANNLNQLVKGAYNQSIMRKPEGSFTLTKGRAFWEEVVEGEEFDPEILRCPLTGRRYRGPAVENINTSPSNTIMGMCIHDEVANVVMKSGDVHKVPIGSELYERGLKQTTLFSRWSEAGARWTYRPRSATGKPQTLELVEISGAESTFERSGGDLKEPVREVLIVRPNGVRIVSRSIGGRTIELKLSDEDRREVEGLLKDLGVDDVKRRDAATAKLAPHYPRARRLIEGALGARKDLEIQTRLKQIRRAAADHYPLKFPYPLEKGKRWKTPYGETYEVLESGKIKTGIGEEFGWRIRMTSASETLELWWSDDLNILLSADRIVEGRKTAGWVLDSFEPE